MTGAQRLVEAAKHTHSEVGEMMLDLQRIQRRLGSLRSELAYAVTIYDSGAVTELPDDNHHDPRD